MAGKTDRTAVQYAFKKLTGRANTSNIKSDAQELIGSTIQAGTQTLFGQDIPLSASRVDYQLFSASNGGPKTAEYVVFTVAAITGTTYDADSATGGGGDGSQSAGPHGYKLFLTGNYESLSSNTKKGTYPYINGQLVHWTLGSLQLIPPNFSQEAPNPYILKIYEAGSGDANQIGDEIPLLDEVDWTFDAYNGILFLQDYDAGKIPAYARGFIYVGDYLSATLGNATGTPGGASTQVQFNDGGAFGGDANFTFNKSTDTMSVSNMSGSLTRLSDGTSYLAAGNNVTITSASNGQVTISSTGGSGGGSGDSAAHYVVTEATGSLSNYKLIEAGPGITLTTGSNSLTVSSDLSEIDGRDKKRYELTSSHPAENPFSTPQSDFGIVFYDPDLIDVYMNGMLTMSGTAAQVSAGTVDYTVFSSGSLSFAFELSDDDAIDVVLSKLNPDGSSTADPAASYLVLASTSSLPHERVFNAGPGLATIDNGPGSNFDVNINDSVVATLTGSVFSGPVTVEGAFTSSLGVGTLATNSSTVHISASNAPTSGSVLVAKSSTEASWQQAIVFGEQPAGTKNGSNLAFSLNSAPINGTDLMLFVNGLLQLSGTSGDYELTGSTINFKLPPYNDDGISAIYRPSV
jgi:hypothetical protein